MLSCRLFFQWLVVTSWVYVDFQTDASMTEKPPNLSSKEETDAMHAAMLGRIEASIMGESALIDRETGRVFWEGGSSNTLNESLISKLEQFGMEHGKAALLSVLITLFYLGVVAGWLRRAIDQSGWKNATESSSNLACVILFTILDWTILKFPKLENKWLILATGALYLFESFACDTRRLLANAISSPSEVEGYIETLRQEKPVVTWEVQCFHYEVRKFFTLFSVIQSIFRKSKEADTSLDVILPRTKNCRPFFPFTKKVIANKASANYQYENCLDSTIAGLWRRAPTANTGAAPFTKIALTKLLVLSDRKSREDYFRQQADFVTEHGRSDEFVEFSTDIQVPKYKSMVLAVRSVEGVPSAKLFRLHLFWIFTLMGLTLPYRIWFKRHCDFLRVTVVKETSSSAITAGYWRWLPSRATLQPIVSGDSNFRSFMQGRSLYGKEKDSIVDSTSPAEEGLPQSSYSPAEEEIDPPAEEDVDPPSDKSQ